MLKEFLGYLRLEPSRPNSVEKCNGYAAQIFADVAKDAHEKDFYTLEDLTNYTRKIKEQFIDPLKKSGMEIRIGENSPQAEQHPNLCEVDPYFEALGKNINESTISFHRLNEIAYYNIAISNRPGELGLARKRYFNDDPNRRVPQVGLILDSFSLIARISIKIRGDGKIIEARFYNDREQQEWDKKAPEGTPFDFNIDPTELIKTKLMPLLKPYVMAQAVSNPTLRKHVMEHYEDPQQKLDF